MNGELITLTIPGERDFHRVAHLVLSGIALRLNVTVEGLEDLQLALDGLLERAEDAEGVTVELRAAGRSLHASVGPFESERVRDELERDPDESLGLRRLLDTVVDGYSLERRDGADWVELEKRVLD